AIEQVIKSGPKTPDLGGTASTTQVGEAIAAAIAQR
ncbi:tartrate dehydrogenase/decarboxylase / D-malate dehydrogenase, partial [Paracidovorax cattleyae]